MENQPNRSYRDRIFENYASAFQGFSAIFDAAGADRWARPYRHYLRGWLPAEPNAPILDIACGSGRLLYLFKQLGYESITGVDISPEQVRLSRQVVPTVLECNALEFLQRHELPFAAIYALDIVEHFTKDEVLRFLDGCRRLLVPGGRLILQTPNSESPWGSMHRYNDFTHEVGFNPNALSCLLKMCGYEQVEARETGPVVHGVASAGRFALWQAIRSGLLLWNLAETGERGSGVLTRVFLMSATSPAA